MLNQNPQCEAGMSFRTHIRLLMWVHLTLGLTLVSFPLMPTFAKNETPELTHFRDCDACSEMVVLPAGDYLMGAIEEEFKGHENNAFMYLDEKPQHHVYV